MKIYTILISSLFLLLSCQQNKEIEPSNPSEIKAELNTKLNHWHKAAAEANLKDYLGFMDTASVYIGTDATENWNKEAFIAFCEPHFSKGKTWDFESLERNVFLNKTNTTAWFDELLKTQMGTCRGSGVLEKSNNEWKLKHYVLSIAIPNENTNEVIQIKSANDSLFQKTLKNKP